jgi:hypothetical protein
VYSVLSVHFAKQRHFCKHQALAIASIGASGAPRVSPTVPEPKEKTPTTTATMADQNKQQGKKDDDYESQPHERSTMAQEKAVNKLKQDKREQGLQSARSRSSSRRARRQRLEKDQRDGKYMHTVSLEVLEEADANGDLQKMGMFERIGPDSTSMDGPVTHARAMRGEIPMRGTNPNEPKWANPEKSKSSLQDEDGLKLTLEANLEIEIELKASIRGDLTLSL